MTMKDLYVQVILQMRIMSQYPGNNELMMH